MAKADNPLRPPQTPPGGSSDTGETEQLLDGRGLPWEGECSAETGDDEDCLPSARNGGREGTLCGDEGDKSELATAEPTLPDSQDRIEFQRDVGGHCNTNLEEDYGPAHPPVPDNKGEQDEDSSVVPPQAQENRARIPRLSDDEQSMQLSTSQDRVNPQHDIGRRQHCDVGSDAEHSRDNDDV